MIPDNISSFYFCKRPLLYFIIFPKFSEKYFLHKKANLHEYIQAMDQPDHVMLVFAITIRKIIRKLIDEFLVAKRFSRLFCPGIKNLFQLIIFEY